MNLRQRLVLFGYPLIEILAFWAVGAVIGFGWALVALLAGIPIGFALWRRAAESVRRGEPAKAASWGVAGLLWLLPGFLTDVLGTLVIIPAVRRIALRRLARFTPSGAVIVGEVVTGPTSPGTFRPSAVILGEGAPSAPRGVLPGHE